MITLHDKVHLAVVWSINILAVMFNIYLITAIILRTPKSLRSYAVFLFCNAAIDLSSAIVSALGSERLLHDHEGSMIFVFLGPCTLISENLCRMSHAVLTILVQQSLLILLLSFAYRLYLLGDVFNGRDPKSPLNIGLLCLLSFLPFILSTVVIYLEMIPVSQKIVNKLHVEAYITASYPIYGTTRVVIINLFACVFSPIVMTFIFIVRSKLIIRIEQANPEEKRHHESIARALTYQMLLPCGVAIGATLWLLDLMEIWSSEIAERLMMITYSLFSLASPIINLTVLPPYRKTLPSIFRKHTAIVNPEA